jgi:hypothetical protein
MMHSWRHVNKFCGPGEAGFSPLWCGTLKPAWNARKQSLQFAPSRAIISPAADAAFGTLHLELKEKQ